MGEMLPVLGQLYVPVGNKCATVYSGELHEVKLPSSLEGKSKEWLSKHVPNLYKLVIFKTSHPMDTFDERIGDVIKCLYYKNKKWDMPPIWPFFDTEDITSYSEDIQYWEYAPLFKHRHNFVVEVRVSHKDRRRAGYRCAYCDEVSPFKTMGF